MIFKEKFLKYLKKYFSFFYLKFFEFTGIFYQLLIFGKNLNYFLNLNNFFIKINYFYLFIFIY